MATFSLWLSDSGFHSRYHLYSFNLSWFASEAEVRWLFFNYWGFYSAFDTTLTLLFRMKQGSKRVGVEQNDSVGHGDDNRW